MLMEIYQHDRPDMFQFVLLGELMGGRVQDLECAWKTANSILAGKELVVDVSAVTKADHLGVALLSRLRESGARLAASRPPNNVEFIQSIGIAVVASARRQSHRPMGFLRCFRSLLGIILRGACPQTDAPPGANWITQSSRPMLAFRSRGEFCIA